MEGDDAFIPSPPISLSQTMATIKESRERSESSQKMVIQKLVAENMSVIEEVRIEGVRSDGRTGWWERQIALSFQHPSDPGAAFS